MGRTCASRGSHLLLPLLLWYRVRLDITPSIGRVPPGFLVSTMVSGCQTGAVYPLVTKLHFYRCKHARVVCSGRGRILEYTCSFLFFYHNTHLANDPWSRSRLSVVTSDRLSLLQGQCCYRHMSPLAFPFDCDIARGVVYMYIQVCAWRETRGAALKTAREVFYHNPLLF